MALAEVAPELEPVYIKFHLYILFALGIDIMPVENRSLRAIYYVYSFFVVGTTCLFGLCEFLDLIFSFEGIEKMTFNLSYTVTHSLGSVKMFLLIAMRNKLWQHFQTLETGIFKPNMARGGTKEFQLIKDGIQLCKYQGYFFYSSVVIIVSARGIYAGFANWPYDKNDYFDGNQTVIVNTKIMPFTTWVPFDYSVSPYYEFVFAFQIFSTMTYGFYIGASDAVICGFMILIKAQFLIIKNELDTLIERAAKLAKIEDSSLTDMDRIEVLDDTVQENLAALVDECVYHHQELIAMCDKAEDTFCYVMLLQFMSSLLIVCFQMFQVSTLSLASMQFLSMMNYLILMIFQVLCYCWHGNEVQLLSGEISQYAYRINWPIMKGPVKKSLLLMMMRSQRPNFFTAGKFSLLSLQTFMTIVRGAGSYFMFLRQMNS